MIQLNVPDDSEVLPCEIPAGKPAFAEGDPVNPTAGSCRTAAVNSGVSLTAGPSLVELDAGAFCVAAEYTVFDQRVPAPLHFDLVIDDVSKRHASHDAPWRVDQADQTVPVSRRSGCSGRRVIAVTLQLEVFDPNAGRTVWSDGGLVSLPPDEDKRIAGNGGVAGADSDAANDGRRSHSAQLHLVSIDGQTDAGREGADFVDAGPELNDAAARRFRRVYARLQRRLVIHAIIYLRPVGLRIIRFITNGNSSGGRLPLGDDQTYKQQKNLLH